MLKVDAPHLNSRIGAMFILYQEFIHGMHIEDLTYAMKVKIIVFKIILFTFRLQLKYSKKMNKWRNPLVNSITFNGFYR